MKLTPADHSFMTVCEFEAIDMSTSGLIEAMKKETNLLNSRADYSMHAVRRSYLRLAAYRDVLHTRQNQIARYA